MRVNRPWLAALIVAAAGASWWLSEGQPIEPADNDGTRPTGTIDYEISGFDVTRMTETGQPAHRLRAVRAQHYIDDDTTHLQAPRLTVFQGEEPPWQVRSETAIASPDGDLILLNGEVRITREAGTDNPPLRIDTRNLRVQPRQDYAETDEHVRVESESNWLDATGMQAWLRPPSRLKFLSQVKAYYVPQADAPD
jgi:lipopolysaccharide export system protein LptC